MQTLKQLLLSLVNATVMLAVVLVLLTLVLVSQVGQLADATTAAAEQAMQGPNAKLAQIATSLQSIEGAVKSGTLDATRAEAMTLQLRRLNGQVEDIRTAIATVRDIPMALALGALPTVLLRWVFHQPKPGMRSAEIRFKTFPRGGAVAAAIGVGT
jgi:hypothetical protein